MNLEPQAPQATLSPEPPRAGPSPAPKTVVLLTATGELQSCAVRQLSEATMARKANLRTAGVLVPTPCPGLPPDWYVYAKKVRQPAVVRCPHDILGPAIFVALQHPPASATEDLLPALLPSLVADVALFRAAPPAADRCEPAPEDDGGGTKRKRAAKPPKGPPPASRAALKKPKAPPRTKRVAAAPPPVLDRDDLRPLELDTYVLG